MKAVVAPAALVVLAVLASVLAGCAPATPLGVNRPEIGPPVKGACWPVPAAAPHLQLQAVSDTVFGSRRIYRLQYDRVSGRTAEERTIASLVRAGFTSSPPQPIDAPFPGLAAVRRVGTAWFRRADFGSVGVAVVPLPDSERYLVHGTLFLILPAPTTAPPAPCPAPLVQEGAA